MKYFEGDFGDYVMDGDYIMFWTNDINCITLLHKDYIVN